MFILFVISYIKRIRKSNGKVIFILNLIWFLLFSIFDKCVASFTDYHASEFAKSSPDGNSEGCQSSLYSYTLVWTSAHFATNTTGRGTSFVQVLPLHNSGHHTFSGTALLQYKYLKNAIIHVVFLMMNI